MHQKGCDLTYLISHGAPELWSGETSSLEVSSESIVVHRLGVSWKSHGMARTAVIERHTRQSGGEIAKRIRRQTPFKDHRYVEL